MLTYAITVIGYALAGLFFSLYRDWKRSAALWRQQSDAWQEEANSRNRALGTVIEPWRKRVDALMTRLDAAGLLDESEQLARGINNGTY